MNYNKKILFVMTNLKTGGIQSAFLNLLNELKNGKIDIDVLCFDTDDNKKLPSFVNPLPSNRFLRMLAVSRKQINKESMLLGLFRYFCGAFVKLFGQKYVYKLLTKSYKKLTGYDAAISFAQSENHSLCGGCNELVLYRINAKKKISFVHCDYEQAGLNTSYSREIYNQFDKIAAVSNGVKDKLINACPEFKEKISVVYNCHNFEKIISMSQEDTVKYLHDKLNFVTVARLSPEKGHKRMLSVFKKLSDEGYDFYWHIVGGGNDKYEMELSHLIECYGLNDKVKLYGNQLNPYRYMKDADILLLPSFHEAAPMVYSEAFILGLPVLSTNTLSADEFISKYEFGLVYDNDEESIYEMSKGIINNPDKIMKFQTIINNDYKPTNEMAIKQFLNIINE